METNKNSYLCKGKSFVLYNDQYDILRLLPDEAKAQLLDGIFLYVRGEQQPEMDTATKVALKFVTLQIDRDKRHYAEVCKARSEAGKKGGRPKKASVDAEDK